VAISAVARALWRSPSGPILLAAQVALSLMIFANVAYVVFVRLETTGRPTGIDLDNIFWISTHPYRPDYNAEVGTQADLEYLNALPDVVSASAASAIPQTYGGIRSQVSGFPGLKGKQRVVYVYRMTGRFIDTLGLHLARGRAPVSSAARTPRDTAGPPENTFGGEVVVTEALADRLFGGGEPALGKALYFSAVDGHPATIVGIIELMQGAPYFAPGADFINELVLTPTFQPTPDELYLIRTRPGDRNRIMATVERQFESVDASRFIDRIQSLATTAAMMRSNDRLNAMTLVVLSSLVLAVTLLGLFGFASFMVTGRIKEIGIRRAIGATSADITRQFLLENLLITSPGIALGCLFTVAFALQLSLLLELPRLPIIFLVAAMALIWVAGLLAALHPALRGARVPPAVATRVA
jgi:putative ABC transport system permease protein